MTTPPTHHPPTLTLTTKPAHKHPPTPSPQGDTGKMSASDASSAVFVTDGPKEIKDKVTRFAFSGGGATAEEQRARGADLEVDVPWKVGRRFGGWGWGLSGGGWGGLGFRFGVLERAGVFILRFISLFILRAAPATHNLTSAN